jgi:hypothetical protein
VEAPGSLSLPSVLAAITLSRSPQFFAPILSHGDHLHSRPWFVTFQPRAILTAATVPSGLDCPALSAESRLRHRCATLRAPQSDAYVTSN